MGGVVDLVDPDHHHFDPGQAEFEVDPSGQVGIDAAATLEVRRAVVLDLTIDRERQWRVEPRDVRTRIDEAFGGEDGRAWRRPSGRRWGGRRGRPGRRGCGRRDGGWSRRTPDLAAARRKKVRSAAERDDDRYSSDRPSGVGVHRRVSSTASRADAVVGWWFGCSRRSPAASARGGRSDLLRATRRGSRRDRAARSCQSCLRGIDLAVSDDRRAQGSGGVVQPGLHRSGGNADDVGDLGQ